MSRIQIDTAQNVLIDYEIASVGDRLLAKIIDILIFIGYYLLFMVLYFSFFSPEDSTLLPTMLILFVAIPFLAYDLIFEVFNNGQSIGKKLRNIKVARLDGTQPTLGNYLLRWIIGLLELKMLGGGALALVAMLFNRHGQRLGDMAAGTTLIKVKQEATLQDTILHSDLYTNYTPIIPEAAMLSDADIRIIKDVLRAYDKRDINFTAMDSLLYETATKIARKIDVQTDMSPYAFLDTIMRDYNHIHGR